MLSGMKTRADFNGFSLKTVKLSDNKETQPGNLPVSSLHFDTTDLKTGFLCVSVSDDLNVLYLLFV